MKVCPKCTEQNEEWMNICQVCGADIRGITKTSYEEKIKMAQKNDPFYIPAEKKTNPYMDLFILIGVLIVILVILIMISL